MARRLFLGLALIGLAGCSGGGSDEILVSAASSLTEAFTEIEAAFEQAHPGADVVINFAASSLLREQILAGAPVDVFASASVEIADEVVDAGRAAEDPVVFAGNEIEIAVPAGNPAKVTGIEDFAREELFIGLCEETVPCGALANEALGRANVVAAIDSYEPNARSLRTKLEEGELDLGMLYVTDVAAGDVDGISLSDVSISSTDYPIVLIEGSPNQDGGRDFIEFVLSATGRDILAKSGFAVP